MDKEISLDLNLALEKHKKGKLAEAEIAYKKIIEKNPTNSNALHLLGLVNYQLGKYEESAKLIEEAIESRPSALYYGNLGMVYDMLSKEEESIKNFKKALEIDPKLPGSYRIYYNLGIYLTKQREFNKAIECYDKSLEMNKDFFDVRWNRGQVLLLLGKFKEGWDDYEYRFKKQKPVDSRTFSKPVWDGSYLNGKRILILSEQGYGDNIQFVRYLPLVKEKGGYVILECKEELKKLFENLSGVDELINKRDLPPDIEFDFYIHLMSLPKIFNTNLSNLPNKIPYLKADPKIVNYFKTKMCSKNFKIGIVWAGNPNQENNLSRSATFQKFMLLKKVSGIDLFSLQKDEASEQLNNSQVIDLLKDTKNFSDTAGVIENLDLVISVDTSVAHLAGAMGKPVWVLLSYNSNWRWLLNRDDCPWYPTMKLFRQKTEGDWGPVFEQVVNELKKMNSKFI